MIAAWHIFNVVMCDRKLSVKLKGKFYKTVIRPAILYDLTRFNKIAI